MNLYAHQPYWLMKDGIVTTTTSLAENISADVAIIGAGISGALCAYYLRDSGLSIAVFDRRHIGMGSTAASTAFLQYEIDTPLNELCKYVGEKNALTSYQLCRKAIYDIKDICDSLPSKLDFHLRPSLHYASFNKHKEQLHKEYSLRKKNDFNVDWLESNDVQKLFGLDAPGAILSADAGEVDAYLLTHALFAAVRDAGHKVYANTRIDQIDYDKHGITLTSDNKSTIRAKKLIIASGYESMRYLPRKIAEVHSTYAFVSEPVEDKFLWHKHSLAWETASPYLYFRTVSGNRVVVGGKDDLFHNPFISDARIKRKTEMLLQSFSKKMKHVPIKPDFSWAGAFMVTKDGLPYIGSIPERPNTFFALGYGGNGITFSAIAAEIIRDLIGEKKNENAHIFSFDR